MLLLPLLLLSNPAKADRVDPPIHSGRAGQTTVKLPRLEGNVAIDGMLDEPQWKAAAILNGFSQFTPVDGVPAADSTEILVWYSASALYVGIRAFDHGGAVHATLATRDQIFNDDNVQMFLSTFNDGRQAMVFAVNPFGVQADGALNENGGSSCGMAGCGSQTRQQPDLSQDFVWESKGRVTPDGYEVEIRIPFKSIRFQAGKTQTWGINFLRTVQRSRQEQTWTAVKLAASSFLAQSGRLEGLTDLDAGHVMDIVPTVTSRVTYGPPASGAAWDYSGGNPQFGGDLRYGLTPNLTLHATAHPDFSQVESDVTQFAFDPRQSVFYPERRPFFLDGVEQFDAPANLIYTRRIVQPVFAGKVTGKVGDNQVGVLAAVDDRSASNYGDNPVFGLIRASHDLGPGSRLGMVWTEQRDGPETNRVVDVDSRMVIDKINSITLTGALAHDDQNGAVNDAALWGVGYSRAGRNFRMNYGVSGIGMNFITRSGFIGQPGVANATIDNSYTWLQVNRTLESLTADVVVAGRWRYDDFVHGGPIQNRQLHFNFNARLRGGWGAGAFYFRESFGYDPSIYTNYGLRQADGTVVPFTGGNARLPNNDYGISGNTPTWKHFDFNGFVLTGLNDENYNEWASGRIVFANVGMDIRPTDHLRFNFAYNDSRVYRPSDRSRVLLQDVAVGTVEYQLSRAFQLRVIAQYSINARDSLRDDSRTNLPIVIRDPSTGIYSPTTAFDSRQLQTNFLFTYLPNPGTVIYLGYGTVDQRPDLIGRATLGPVQSDFFLKVSYLWRMRG
jgi:hypothetical protein